MAKGDRDAANNQISTQGSFAQGNLNNNRTAFGNQNNTIWNNYLASTAQQGNDYNSIMKNYGDVYNQASQPNGGSFGNEYQGYADLAKNGGGAGFDATPINDAIAGFRGFAENGGFSDQNIQDIRARAVAPTRSIYSSAQANLDRNRSLNGNYSPNYAAAQAKMAREEAMGIGEQDTNANAQIAQQVQQGKLAGFTGMSTAGLGLASATLQADQINNQMKLAGLGGMSDIDKANLTARLAATQGQQSLFGTTPGMANMFGNQLARSNEDLVNTQGQQNQLGLGLINSTINASGIPSNFQQGLGNFSQMARLAGNALSMFGGGGSPGGGNNGATNPLSFGSRGANNFGGSNFPGNPNASTFGSNDPFGNNLPGYTNEYNWTNPGYSGYPGDFGQSGQGPGMTGYDPSSVQEDSRSFNPADYPADWRWNNNIADTPYFYQ